jgi:N-acetylglutamate synthase-like GNAT family acetyltransferase
METAVIESGSGEMEAARRLLSEAGLPSDDIADTGVMLWGLFDAGRLVAVVGLEREGGVGLLRSLAVAPAHRGGGLARQLCNLVFERARRADIEALYLLSEDAAAFFHPLGFAQIGRDQAPPEIAATRQFSSLCPGDAAFMRKRL